MRGTVNPFPTRHGGSNPSLPTKLIVRALLFARVSLFVVEIKTENDDKEAGSTPPEFAYYGT